MTEGITPAALFIKTVFFDTVFQNCANQLLQFHLLQLADHNELCKDIFFHRNDIAFFIRAMGATFSDTQMKSLLEGKKTLVRGLKGKKGSYDAYLIPEGIEDYSYIKDGKEIKGSQYKFKMEFPPRKSK